MGRWSVYRDTERGAIAVIVVAIVGILIGAVATTGVLLATGRLDLSGDNDIGTVLEDVLGGDAQVREDDNGITLGTGGFTLKGSKELPENFPDHIPIAGSDEVIGSTVKKRPDDTVSYYDVFFRSDDSAQEVRDGYERRLRERGWKIENKDKQDDALVLRSSRRELTFTLAVQPRNEETDDTLYRLRVDTEEE